MSRTNKAAFVDTVNGTSLSTLTTARAKLIIDDRKVINDLDSTVRTGLLALHTTNATV